MCQLRAHDMPLSFSPVYLGRDSHRVFLSPCSIDACLGLLPQAVHSDVVELWPDVVTFAFWPAFPFHCVRAATFSANRGYSFLSADRCCLMLRSDSTVNRGGFAAWINVYQPAPGAPTRCGRPACWD